MKTAFQTLFVTLSLLTGVLHVHAQGTAFTYQGRFTDNGAPYTGNVEIQATLWNADSGGTQIAANAPAQVVVGATNGLFVLPLNFGANFPGANRWLQLEVRTGLGAFTPLVPRQPLTPTPYAITAGNLTGPLPAAQLSGPVASANLAGTYSSALTLNNAANSFSGSGAGLTTLNAGQLTSGTVPDARLGANVARTNQVWLLGGNAGAAPGANFLGTTDAQSLELRVNSTRALRLEPNATSPNVIGGYLSNSVSPGFYGATIAGGGRAGLPHTVSGHHGTIGGGDANTVSGQDGTIAGGGGNFVAGGYGSIGGGLFNNNLAYLGTISGGANHRIGVNANSGVIAGGFAHSIADNAFDGTIGGGSYNSIGTNSSYVTISGGRSNTIQPNVISATLGGGLQNTIQTNAHYATIGGGSGNTIQPNAEHATIGGGYGSTIQSYAQISTIGGGYLNTIQFAAIGATIAGGDDNKIQAFGNFSTIGGGLLNTIQTNADYATIPGGGDNNCAADYTFAAGRRAKANHQGSFVWADSQQANFASTANNQFCVRASGGVQLNGDTPIYFGSTLSQKINLYGTTFGIGIQSGIQYSRVGVGGGFGWYAGGIHDPGTYNPGGGVVLMKVDGSGLTVNNAIVSSSDRNMKAGFTPVDPMAILERVVALPIQRWHFTNDVSTPHVGPMAQDFYAAFNVGPDDKHIATVDADGVALAAIQGLNQKLEEKDAELKALKQTVAELKAAFDQLGRAQRSNPVTR